MCRARWRRSGERDVEDEVEREWRGGGGNVEDEVVEKMWWATWRRKCGGRGGEDVEGEMEEEMWRTMWRRCGGRDGDLENEVEVEVRRSKVEVDEELLRTRSNVCEGTRGKGTKCGGTRSSRSCQGARSMRRSGGPGRGEASAKGRGRGGEEEDQVEEEVPRGEGVQEGRRLRSRIASCSVGGVG